MHTLKTTTFVCFALTLLLLAAPASAQNYLVGEGTYRLGGTISYTSQGGDLYGGEENRLGTLTLNPSVQYFLAPGFAVGADMLVNRTSQDDFSQTQLSIGPSASYFFGDADSQAYPFFTVNPVYSRLSFDNGDGEDTSTNGYGAALSGGVAFQLARNVALTGEGFYLYESFSPEDLDDSVTGNTFGVRIGVSAFIY